MAIEIEHLASKANPTNRKRSSALDKVYALSGIHPDRIEELRDTTVEARAKVATTFVALQKYLSRQLKSHKEGSQVDGFEIPEEADHLFRDLQDLLLFSRDAQWKFDLEELIPVIRICASFQGHDSWTCEKLSARSQECLNLVLPVYAKPSQLLENAINYMLNAVIQPSFAGTSTIARRRSRPYDGTGKRTNWEKIPREDAFENQPWKTEVVETVALLEWCSERSKMNDVNRNLSMMAPPILTLLDDYDLTMKIRGVGCLTRLLDDVSPSLVRANGLGEVFFDALLPGLTYTSPTETDPPVLETSLPCIVKLCGVIETPGSSECRSRFERLLEKGVLTAFAYGGDRISIRMALLESLPPIIKGVGIEIVRHFKILFPLIYETLQTPIVRRPTRNRKLEEHRKPYRLHIAALEALSAMIAVAWMRISPHRKQILGSFAALWDVCVHESLDQCDEDLASRMKLMADVKEITDKLLLLER